MLMYVNLKNIQKVKKYHNEMQNVTQLQMFGTTFLNRVGKEDAELLLDMSVIKGKVNHI